MTNPVIKQAIQGIIKGDQPTPCVWRGSSVEFNGNALEAILQQVWDSAHAVGYDAGATSAPVINDDRLEFNIKEYTDALFQQKNYKPSKDYIAFILRTFYRCGYEAGKKVNNG